MPGPAQWRVFETPVEYIRDGDRLPLLVAQPSRKQSWRNVERDPAVEVTLAGPCRPAAATVKAGAAATANLERYVAARPRAARLAAAVDAPVMVVLKVR